MPQLYVFPLLDRLLSQIKATSMPKHFLTGFDPGHNDIQLLCLTFSAHPAPSEPFYKTTFFSGLVGRVPVPQKSDCCWG